MPRTALIAALLVALAVSQVMVYRLAKDVGRLSGRQEVFDSFAANPEDGTCFAKGGCK